MKTSVIHLRLAAFYLLAMFFMVGCFELHRGYYDAANTAGWKSWHEVGGNFFRFPISHAPKWYIELRGVQKGSLRVQIGSDAFKDTGAKKYVIEIPLQ